MWVLHNYIYIEMNQYESYGKLYGYPKCCIQQFIWRVNNCVPPKRIQKKVSNSTGFIPCYYCSRKVLSKQCKLEDLIQNRIEILKFPNSRNM